MDEQELEWTNNQRVKNRLELFHCHRIPTLYSKINNKFKDLSSFNSVLIRILAKDYIGRIYTNYFGIQLTSTAIAFVHLPRGEISICVDGLFVFI